MGASPTLTMSEDGGAGVTAATFTITLGSPISAVTTTGDGVYASIPTLTVTNDSNDSTGSGAVLTVSNLTYAIASLTINNGGYGYSSTPQVSFSGGNATNDAVATAVLVLFLF